jgi:ATP-dependent DNA helicase RecQ
VSDGFEWLVKALRGFPGLEVLPGNAERWPSPQRRLADALAMAASADLALPAAPRDLVPLVRQVLLGRENGDRFPVAVASHARLPTRDQWLEGGCECQAFEGGVTVRARQWRPSWLAGTADDPPAQAASLGRHAGLGPAVDIEPPADPFYQAATRRTEYRTAGQRIALHTVLAAKPGSTVIANLPTRTGKSALAFVPALLGASQGRTALVIVPTVALAIDQERQFLQLQSPLADAPRNLAFHGELSDQTKQDMKRRLRDGEQVILFTSPEGLLGALRLAVQEAAETGRLSLFAVDEAHIVSQWGEDFRPEFQALGNVRRDLLRVSPTPFTTLLMTGTLTATTLDALVLLFRSPIGTHLVSSVDLRLEPSYWQAYCDSEQEREQRLMEAIHHLPRPVILYTTKVTHAEAWLMRLQTAGYRRVTSVTGKTSAKGRRDAIERVRGDAPDSEGTRRTGADVVVATSAYGLGVDQPDVRAVVHACVPESIDRFYQEVGRGGRDGAPSLSLVLHTSVDRAMAKRLSLTTVIGVDKARRRWNAMWAARGSRSGIGDAGLVRIDTIPPYLSDNNERNEQWNLLTLLLMQRANMIDLELPTPPEKPPEEDPDAWNDLWVEHVVKLRAGNLVDLDRWDELEEQARATHQRDEVSLELMETALTGSEPLDRLLKAAYEIPAGASITLPDAVVRVGGSHGGCTASRRAGTRVRRDSAPTPTALSGADWTLYGRLGELLGDNAPLTVHYEPPPPGGAAGLRRRIGRAIEALVRGGVRTVAAPADVLGWDVMINAWRRAPSRSVFVGERFDPHTLPGCPALLIATKGTSARELRTFYTARPPRVVICPSDLPDFERADRTTPEIRRPELSLDGLLRSLA